MADRFWAIPQLKQLLPLEDRELVELLTYTETLPADEAAEHLHNLLGDSPEAVRFVAEFGAHKRDGSAGKQPDGDHKTQYAPPPYPPPTNGATVSGNGDVKGAPTSSTDDKPTGYAPPPSAPRTNSASASNGISSRTVPHNHTNPVIEAARVRARDEQDMQQRLQSLQYQYHIYNSDIEPEHETDYPCSCPIHQYQAAKWRRYSVQDMWSNAVMYPGEKAYSDSSSNSYSPRPSLFTNNPYKLRVASPYGYWQKGMWSMQRPVPGYHAQSIHQTIKLNNSLNQQAQMDIDAREPKHNIWDESGVSDLMRTMSINEKRRSGVVDSKAPVKASDEKRQSLMPVPEADSERPKASKMSSFRKAIGIKSTAERQVASTQKAVGKGQSLREAIEAEEQGRWPDEQWRHIVAMYQEKVGMSGMIADLRARKPTQYLHLLRAGYFEPIPVAWATQNSNPLKFSIEAASGWRGITPAWRGYEDTAEERLYWVLNHRIGSVGVRLKPDFISEMNMARGRMAKAVEPPPAYYSNTDTCHIQHTDTSGYSKQVMPAPFQPFDRPENPNDDTMILLDVSGSMDFDPVRPIYDQYLITQYVRSTQPKNKDVAKAIIRRFADAMAVHDHAFGGYDLVTFANSASYIGSVNHQNLDLMWRNVRLGGGTRVMTGWQKVKEKHFQKHSESATHHPVYGWQAGPETPMLRLLLLLDGEATDMDEFELDLLGLSWAHVTIFLIGVDGCPHHHRHANELQRISDVNHHVSFVDAQGNFPERFVTHELLKRHLGYDVSMQEFETMEELPPYTEV